MAKDPTSPTRRSVLGAVMAVPAMAATAAATAAQPTSSDCSMAGWRPTVPEPVFDPRPMPRIKPLVYEQVDEKTRKIWDEQRPAPGGPTQTPGVEHDSFRIKMRHPELNRVQSPFVNYLKNSTTLPLRHRELAIMRSAWLGGVDDQYVNHAKIGMESGLTQEEIDRIPSGFEAPGWSAEERAVIKAADELHFWCRLSDATWTALDSFYDERQLLELLTLIGSYRTLSYVQNTVGIRPVTGKTPNIPGNRFQFT